MILVEDATNPTFYAYFRGFMALFLGFGLKVKLYFSKEIGNPPEMIVC